MGVSKWARRFVVATVAVVSLSLVAAAGPAQAFVPPPPVPPIVVAPVATATAEVVGAGAVACAASVFCAVGVGAVVVGTALYMTRDSWVPWVKGMIPGLGEQSETLGGSATVVGSLVVTGGNWEFTVVNQHQTGAYNVRGTTTYVCEFGGVYSIADKALATTMQPNTIGKVSGSCTSGTVVALWFAPIWDSLVKRYEPGNRLEWGGANLDGLGKAVKYRVTVQCRRTDGSSTSVQVEYGGAAGGFVMPSCEANGAGIGSVGTGVKVEGQIPGQPAWQRVYETTPSYGTRFTECDVALGKTPCVLQVKVKGVPCQVGASQCSEWTRRVQEGSTDYECWWGPYQVPLVQCDMLERAYRVGGAQLTKPNTDGDPDTQLDLNPDGSPKTGTGTGTGPGGKVEVEVPPATVPRTSPNGDPVAEHDPDGQNCYPTGTAAFNPLEWVLRPVQCALVWAFVPSTAAVETITQGAKNDVMGSSVGQWWDAVGAWGDAFAGTGLGQLGCRGPAVPTGVLGDKGALPATIYPFDACSGPKAVAAATSHMVLSITIVFLSGWRLVRIVGRPFGYDLDLMNGGGTSRP